MATFLLIHGMWHGGWCWEQLSPLLTARGHHVLAPDLPGMGTDRTPWTEDVLGQWTDFLVALVEEQAEPVILVGHSRGGLLASTVAERLPERVRMAVYLVAPLLVDGEALTDLQDAIVSMLPALRFSSDGRFSSFDPTYAPDLLYTQVRPEVAARAAERLVDDPLQPASARLRLSAERFGRVPLAYIETLNDKTASIELQRSVQTRWPCNHVVSLPSDHSPFYSMPERLAETLDDFARVDAR